jgi:hypothetical protein
MFIMHARESIDFDHNTDEGFNFDRLSLPCCLLTTANRPNVFKIQHRSVSDAEL